MPDILPDSRLTRSDLGAVIMDWPLSNGRTIRLECIPCFCANCGCSGPYVPRDNTTFACWLCNKCVETHGEIVGTYLQPDHEFWAALDAEMVARFGRSATPIEIATLLDQGDRTFEKLLKDSPIRLANPTHFA